MKKAWKGLLAILGVIVLTFALIIADAFRRAVNAIELHETLLKKDIALLRSRDLPLPYLRGKDLSFDRLSKLPFPAQGATDAGLEHGHRGQTEVSAGRIRRLLDNSVGSVGEDEVSLSFLTSYTVEQYLLALALTLDTYRPGGFRAWQARRVCEIPILRDLCLSMVQRKPQAAELKTILETLNQLLAARSPADDFINGEFLLDRAEVLKVIPLRSDPTSMMNSAPRWRECFSWRILVAKSLNQLSDDYYAIREPGPYEIHESTSYGVLKAADPRIHTRSLLRADARSNILSDRHALAYWQAARLVAALQLFQEEKRREPRDLAELVPDRLPAIPVCPYGGIPYVYGKGRLKAQQLNLSFRVTR